jgi:DNA-binding CsgD family transcriptional regulator
VLRGVTAHQRISAKTMKSPLELPTLTPREEAILALITQGVTSRAAGTTLGINQRTVEFHRANIMLKFSAKRRGTNENCAQ